MVNQGFFETVYIARIAEIVGPNYFSGLWVYWLTYQICRNVFTGSLENKLAKCSLIFCVKQQRQKPAKLSATEFIYAHGV